MALLNWDLSDGEEAASNIKTPEVAKPHKREKRKKGKQSTDAGQEISKTEDEETTEMKIKSAEKVKSSEKKSKNRSSEETTSPKKSEKPSTKGKFKISLNVHSSAESRVKDDSVEQDDEAAEENLQETASQDDQEDETISAKKKKMAASKKKSVKYKERKRKRKLNELKSTMPKALLDEYLKPHIPEEAPQQSSLNYLRLWKSARAAWKFSKVRQTWLLQNIYNSANIIDSDFEILLEYIEPLKGNSKVETVKQATEFLEKYKDSSEENSKLITSRATQILQMLD